METKSIVPPDGGINKSLPNHLIPETSWTDCLNMYFGNGFIKKINGWQKITSNKMDGTIRFIGNYLKYNGDKFLVFATNSKIYRLNDSTLSFIDLTLPQAWILNTPYSDDSTSANFCIPTVPNNHYYKCTTAGVSGDTEPSWPTTGGTVTDGTAVWTDMGTYLTLNGTLNYPVFMENAQNNIIITNYLDPIHYWNGTNDIIRELPGTNELEGWVGSSNVLKAKCILYSNGFLILGHTEENGDTYPQRIRWSQYMNINKWVNEPDGSGQAGFGDLIEGTDIVQRLMQLNNYVIVYKERSIQIMSYVGGDLIWDKRPSVTNIGLISPRAIVDTGNEHIFLGQDNFYSFDLISPKKIGDDISNYFFEELLNPKYSHNVEAFYNPSIPEVSFTFASIQSNDGVPDMSIVYNTNTRKWSLRESPMTSFGNYTVQQTVTFDDIELTFDEITDIYDSSLNLENAPINIAGDNSGYIYKIIGGSKDGEELPCYAISKLFDLGDPTILKRLLRIQLMVSREEEYNLNVYIGTADNVDEDVYWNGPYQILLSSSVSPWIDVDITSRYFYIKFETSLKNQPFKLSGYNLWFNKRGRQ